MNTFLDTYNLPGLNHEEIHNLKRSVTSKLIKAVIKSLPVTKSLVPDHFSAEFYPMFKGKLIPILLKLFRKIKEKRMLPNSF